MKVELRPYDPVAAQFVLARIDPYDQREAELARGAPTTGPELFAEWHAHNAYRVASHVAYAGVSRRPFAVLGLSSTGQAGVGAAALLACDHERWSGPLARLAVMIRLQFPAWCAAQQVHRIECRCWRDHPTAAGLLNAMGFRQEADMRGFGGTGAAHFLQFAWTQT